MKIIDFECEKMRGPGADEMERDERATPAALKTLATVAVQVNDQHWGRSGRGRSGGSNHGGRSSRQCFIDFDALVVGSSWPLPDAVSQQLPCARITQHGHQSRATSNDISSSGRIMQQATITR
jgi:hypothetical protein